MTKRLFVGFVLFQSCCAFSIAEPSPPAAGRRQLPSALAYSPAPGSPLRKEILDYIRPFCERELNQPIIFNVLTLSVSNDGAMGVLIPLRKNGRPIPKVERYLAVLGRANNTWRLETLRTNPNDAEIANSIKSFVLPTTPPDSQGGEAKGSLPQDQRSKNLDQRETELNRRATELDQKEAEIKRRTAELDESSPHSPILQSPSAQAASSKSNITVSPSLVLAPEAVEAKRNAVGIWTGKGGDGVCLRLVVKADDTYEEQTPLITADNWGKPETGTWEVFTDKYSDTGKRFYGLNLSEGGFVILISNSKMRHPNLSIDLVKGDSFPFSK